MRGTVKFFNEAKGFGFIRDNSGKDYFVHKTDVPKDLILNTGDQVQFEPAQGPKGEKATKVKREM